MTPEEFERDARAVIRRDPTKLIVPLPSDSGMFRIANVAWDNWSANFISSQPRRWTHEGQSSRYFANEVEVCAAELGYFNTDVTPDVVVELWETIREAPAISI